MAVAQDALFQLGDRRFTWDPAKSRSNAQRHGITFEEAATTWLYLDTIERFDEEHSENEGRWLRIGQSLRGALLVTWSTIRLRDGEEVIRLICSRRAVVSERKLYEEEIR